MQVIRAVWCEFQITADVEFGACVPDYEAYRTAYPREAHVDDLLRVLGQCGAARRSTSCSQRSRRFVAVADGEVAVFDPVDKQFSQAHGGDLGVRAHARQRRRTLPRFGERPEFEACLAQHRHRVVISADFFRERARLRESVRRRAQCAAFVRFGQIEMRAELQA